MGTLGAGTAIQASYFIAAALFIFGLKRMSSPVTARSGIVWAGVGMVVATLITFLTFPVLLVGSVAFRLASAQ